MNSLTLSQLVLVLKREVLSFVVFIFFLFLCCCRIAAFAFVSAGLSTCKSELSDYAYNLLPDFERWSLPPTKYCGCARFSLEKPLKKPDNSYGFVSIYRTMNGVILYGENVVFRFPSVHRLAIQFGGKTWIFGSNTGKQLQFLPAKADWKDGGEAWRQFRKMHWDTQAEAADALGVSRFSIAAAERGQRKIPVAAVMRWMEQKREKRERERKKPMTYREAKRALLNAGQDESDDNQ